MSINNKVRLKVLRYDLYEMYNNMTVECDKEKRKELILDDIQKLMYSHGTIDIAFLHGINPNTSSVLDEILSENGFKKVYSVLEMYTDGEMRFSIAVVRMDRLDSTTDITFMYRDWNGKGECTNELGRDTGGLMLLQLQVGDTTYIVGDISCKHKSEASTHFWAEQALSYAVEHMKDEKVACMIVGDNSVFKDLSYVAIIQLGFTGCWFHTRPRRIPALIMNDDAEYKYHCWLKKSLSDADMGAVNSRTIYCNDTTGRICNRLKSGKKDAFIADLCIQYD